MAPYIKDIHKAGVRVVSNAGGTNPMACAAALHDVVKKAKLDLKIAVVTGDDLIKQSDALKNAGTVDMELGKPFPEKIHSMNAYLGARPISRALDLGADIVVTGRCVDSSIVLGPLIHSFGWKRNEFDLLAAGIFRCRGRWSRLSALQTFSRTCCLRNTHSVMPNKISKERSQALASRRSSVCTRAVTRCISIFFVEFQVYFGQDYSRTAWIHSIVDCSTMLCAPLGSYVSNHVSCQVGIMIGGLLATTGLVLSSFATSLEYLYLTLGVLTGVGFALCYSPAIAMVGQYFEKRKALAYGIAMSGSGIGTFILAPVVQLLIEQYSWRGALLILGGFVANLCVCGALMRPIKFKGEDFTHYSLQQEVTPEESNKNNVHSSGTCTSLGPDCTHKSLCYCSQKEYSFILKPNFIILSISFLFLAYGCSPPFVYLVPYALSVGVSHQQAAFLMSILGIIDIVGNITFGWLTDRRFLKEHRYFCYLIAVGLDGLCCLFLPILRCFQLLVPFSVTFGYFDGAYVALIPVVTGDVVGPSNLSSALGVVFFLHAVPYLVSPPISGLLVDTTGDYTAAFLLSGFSMIFCAVLLGFSKVIKKIKNKKLTLTVPTTDTRQEIWTNGDLPHTVTEDLNQKV
ncbi:monocarboxylate transporter 12 [Pelobates cultripes]|uniref:Monocarboxylate transporter 12 n=1 Tax=Pelobates cultripes TaxID=61616 RepID=A0AAD1TA75_PELCU|nr:monocarboxylate transporter 12 [Pelobates cultripes]